MLLPLLVRFMRISKFSEVTGYTEEAIRSKIKRGDWMMGKVWKKAPDGKVLIDIEGFYEWVENGNGLESAPQATRPSTSTSFTKASGAKKESNLSPQPLT